MVLNWVRMVFRGHQKTEVLLSMNQIHQVKLLYQVLPEHTSPILIHQEMTLYRYLTFPGYLTIGTPIITYGCGTASISISISGGSGSYSYAWYGSNGFYSTDVNPSITDLDIIETYVCSVADTGSNNEHAVILYCQSKPVTYYPQTLIIDITNTTSSCQNNTLTATFYQTYLNPNLPGLDITNAVGEWTFADLDSNSTIEANIAGTYTYTVTYGSGCTVSKDFVVETDYVPDLMSVVVTILDQTQIVATVTGGVSCYIYELFSNEVSGVISTGFDGANSFTFNVESDGIYNVTVIDSTGCTATSNDVYVEVIPQVTISFDGSRLVSTITPAFNTYYYTWVVGGELIPFKVKPNLNVHANGSYYLQVTYLDVNGRRQIVNSNIVVINSLDISLSINLGDVVVPSNGKICLNQLHQKYIVAQIEGGKLHTNMHGIVIRN